MNGYRKFCDVGVQLVSLESNIIYIAEALFRAGGKWLKYFVSMYLAVEELESCRNS